MFRPKDKTILCSSFIATPLGKMIAIADETSLFVLEFTDQKNVDRKIEELKIKTGCEIISQTNPIIDLITTELKENFAGTLQNFVTPFHLLGTSFQCKVWNYLSTVPYGSICTYAKQACTIRNQKAYRAVALANSNNTLAIIVPCHRIIGSNGKLCGYAAGLDRKQWLINHEKRNT